MSKIEESDFEASIDILYKIYELYKDYIKVQDDDLVLFENLYNNKNYNKMVEAFK